MNSTLTKEEIDFFDQWGVDISNLSKSEIDLWLDQARSLGEL